MRRSVRPSMSSVPIWKFVANRSTGTKHNRVWFSLVLVRLLPRRAEILVMSMCHELTTQDTSSCCIELLPIVFGPAELPRSQSPFPGIHWRGV